MSGDDAQSGLLAGEIERERSRGFHGAMWLCAGQLLLAGLYGICLKELAVISATEPGTYPKENMPVSALAWFTAWGLPFTGLALAAFSFWHVAASAYRTQQLARLWRERETSTPLRGGAWSLLILPLIFFALWFAAVRLHSAGIESGIENWRSIPQDQARLMDPGDGRFRYAG